jgi:RNA polymerase sigma-70 factor (ECF subfamily)
VSNRFAERPPAADRTTALLERAKAGDRRAFDDLAEPLCKELQLHCYRMLGSIHDAEDLVQETLLRAWRGLAEFEGRAPFRSWLYRIATNACLNALASRKSAQRLLPEVLGPPAEAPPQHAAADIAWLEPYPDAALAAVAPAAAGPEARYEMREAVQLAFVAAVQHLPPRQRAVLLLRDVLGWSAAEAAQSLDASVASITSALQRAREALAAGDVSADPREPDDAQRALLRRYVETWEAGDLDGLVALLKDDAVLSMPPFREWYAGRDAIRRFFARVLSLYGHGAFRLLPTAANGQPAFALYSRARDSAEFRAHSIQVLTIQDAEIQVLTNFINAELFEPFGLPLTLAARRPSSE